MKAVLNNGLIACVTALALALTGAGEAVAQGGSSPTSLRYGTGLFDIPVADVVPHMSIFGTYSGFGVKADQRVQTDATGQIIGVGPAVDFWAQDAAVGLGLFDRVELGASFQNFADADVGGTMVGGFGKFAILSPREHGIGLAAGARFVTSPSFDAVDPSVDYQPPRLGFPDHQFRETYVGAADDVSTTFSPYLVGTARFAGPTVEQFVEYDMSFTLGWGYGMFNQGEDLSWYAVPWSNGIFFGSDIAFQLTPGTVLHTMGEWNGYEANAGIQLDLSGVKVGAFGLGLNYRGANRTEYLSTKYGIMASLALCPDQGGLCKPSLVERVKPDTVELPAPPPDTVVVEREVAPPLPTGTPTNICLATGESVEVLVSAQGDTLVGPDRVPVSTLRPGVVFAGSYAGSADWFVQDEAITFDDRDYQKSGGEVRLDCGDIMRVGEHMGVPLFAESSAETPYEIIYVPVRAGVWQGYQTGLQRTRGD